MNAELFPELTPVETAPSAAIFEHERARVLRGDSRLLVAQLAPNSLDSCVTDPPYEIGFMGKGWDNSGIAFDPGFWRLVLRALKPGGHLLAFGGTVTCHRMTCAIEDAGFEIRDRIPTWLYGTGFPKSVDVARAVEMDRCVLPGRHCDKNLPKGAKAQAGDHLCPSLPDVQAEFGGRGTALKPAHEPVTMARKPLDGTIATNVQRWGTGGLNIDACRLAHTGDGRWGEGRRPPGFVDTGAERGDGAPNGKKHDAGRFPANVVFDEEAAAVLDEQSGILKSGVMKKGTKRKTRQGVAFGTMGEDTTTTTTIGDEGGASRFFYVAKPSRSERDVGCEELAVTTGGEATNREDDSDGLTPRAGAGRNGGARNFHPTVKPVSLMRYLVRLVTPPGGKVLDPFTGSGSTGVGAVLEGCSFLGFELTAEYAPIIAGRLQAAVEGRFGEVVAIDT